MNLIRRTDYHQTVISLFMVLLLLPIGISLARAGILYSWWIYLLLIPVILVGFRKRNSLPLVVHAGLIGLMFSMLLAYGYQWGDRIYQRILNPPVWDFQVFWLNGRVASEGLNFYNAESYYSVAERYLVFDNEYAEEVLDPAFVYPPPAMFIFAPIGCFDIQTAVVLWYIAQILFVMLCIYTAWKMFVKEEGLVGLLLVAVMVVIFSPSFITIKFAQLNFMMLLMALFALQDRERPRAGIWLALGIITKPIIAILLLYFFLKGQWKTIILTILVLFVLSILTIMIYGLDNFAPYFTSNPTAKLPNWLYFETFYQSLLSITVRVTNFDFNTGSPLLQPIFLIPALFFTLSTMVLVYRVKEKSSQTLLYILTVMMALLMYPHTQKYYGVLLLILIIMLWMRKDLLGIWPSIGVITLIYSGAAFGNGGYLFFVVVFCWLLSAVMSIPGLLSSSLSEAGHQ
jgi:hypothetical protein